jgi:DNA polymerase (family 10)
MSINKQIAKIFQNFADIYEILSDEYKHDKTLKFKIRAYKQAALTIENLAIDLRAIKDDPKALDKIPGIGKTLAEKIHEYLTTGRISAYEKLSQEIPAGLLPMLDVPNLGPKKIKLFYDSLKIQNLEDLTAKIKDGTVETLPGMGKKSAEKILESIEKINERGQKFSFKEARDEANDLIKHIQNKPELFEKINYAGSLRRAKIIVGDIDIICSSNKPELLKKHFHTYPEISQLIAEGPTKISVYLKSGVQLDFRVVKPDEFGAALQYFTGSKAHNVKLRTIAKNLGYKISEYGIFKLENGSQIKVGGQDENDIYKTLGLPFIEPEIRENTGELENLTTNNQPQLIENIDIKGDLHSHSNFSDGKNTILEMAKKAEQLGYEYIAITDHSPTSYIANGLSTERLQDKKIAIAEAQSQTSIKILFGTEVDILADGSLDYPDEILNQFDIVVASIHSGLNKDNTERIIKAMNNKYVHIIGHPQTSMINKREASPNDWSKIFTNAKATNTILEINGSPQRLDLNGELVYEAQKFGCLFSTNTDAHSTDGLNTMDLAIGQARRGQLNKEQVINTYSLNQLLKVIKNK